MNNKFNPKVSIIVPVYNVSSYIERCLSSIMKQTYSNIECILVDDVSPDDSIDKCEEMISKYNGPIVFSIIHHLKNRGLSAARNSGTEVATGEYIYYLDSDDEIKPECIMLLVNVVRYHPDVEMVQGKVETIPEKSYYKNSLLERVNFVDDNLWIRRGFYSIQNRLPVNAWDKLIKKTFLIENDLLFKEGLIHEDELWMYHVVKKLTKLGVVHETTYVHYCETNGSIMATTTFNKTAIHWSVILEEILKHLDEPLYKRQLLRYFYSVIYFYGCDGKVSYVKLFDEYRRLINNYNLFILSLLTLGMKKIYPNKLWYCIRWLILRYLVVKLADK